MPDDKKGGLKAWFSKQKPIDPDEQIRQAQQFKRQQEEIKKRRKLQIMAEREAAYMPPGVDLTQLWAEEEETSGMTTILLIALIVLQLTAIVLGLFHL